MQFEDAIIFNAVYDTCNSISTNKIEVMFNNNSLSVLVAIGCMHAIAYHKFYTHSM